jgi:hypothetical protein
MDPGWRSRKWLPLVCGLVLAACGGDDEKPAADKAPASGNALARRCSLEPASGDSGFPSGLLPDGSVVVGDGAAIVPGELPDVYKQLQASAGAAGLEVRDSELETLDAELELGRPDGELGLQLSLPRDCPRATQVDVRG